MISHEAQLIIKSSNDPYTARSKDYPTSMIIVVDGQSKAECGPDRALEEDEKDQNEWDLKLANDLIELLRELHAIYVRCLLAITP